MKDKKPKHFIDSWREPLFLDILGQMVQIRVDGFSGPVDLLLDLIDREELDITVLSLAQVTDQYWNEIDTEAGAAPETLAEFLTIGSKLLYIKSCAPPTPPPSKKDLEGQVREGRGELWHRLEGAE